MPGVISNNYADGITLSANPTTLTGTITNAQAAVYAGAGTDWTLTNDGLISSSSYYGVALIGPGAVSNAAGASIAGYFGGIVGYRDITLTNAGTIGATSNFGSGVLSYQYGDVDNLAGAVITGDEAINLSYGGTVENAGTIAATEFAIITGGGLIDNAAGGVIRGEIPILFEGSGTVINAGTIAAVPGGIAISFDGPNNVLVLEPGGVLTGPVDGFRAGDMLDFAGLTASSASFAGGILTLYAGSASPCRTGLMTRRVTASPSAAPAAGQGCRARNTVWSTPSRPKLNVSPPLSKSCPSGSASPARSRGMPPASPHPIESPSTASLAPSACRARA